MLSWRGQPEECIRWIEHAKAINPLWPAYYDGAFSAALYDLDQYEEAARVLSRLPLLTARQELRLAATYARMGELDLARQHVARARALAPDLDFVEAARLGWTSEHEHTLRHMTEGIELALRVAEEIKGQSDHPSPERT
jgi:tetratricopeptide (TPR) repeat protein